MKVRKAIIPAAGLGTRFLPATKAQPKEMLPIVDKPAIQYIVEEAVASGIEEILIITGRNKGSMEDHFDRNIELETKLEKDNKQDLLKLTNTIDDRVAIHYIRQKIPKGLGHAISCAKTFVANEPFAVLLGDDIVDNPVPCTKQLIDVYEKYQCSVLGVQQVKKEDVSKYGILKVSSANGDVYQVEDMVEKPDEKNAPSDIAILGRYIITPDIFPVLEKTLPGKGNEIQLTDALKTLCQTQAIYAYKFKGKRYDVGNKLGFLEATVEFALKRDDLKQSFAQYLQKLVASKLYTEAVAAKGDDI